MPAQLLERRSALTTLRAAVDAALGGAGSVALLTGEAGIGKTSVVRHLLAEVDPAVRALSGGCDDLIAPAPLAPLREAVANHGGPLAAALAAPHLPTAPSAPAGAHPLVAVLPAMLAELRGAPATLLVVEDIHWADEATIDVLIYTARRIGSLPAVLLLTMRDDVDDAHPVHRLLGSLTAAPVVRVPLAALSAAAVARMAAGTGHDGAALHALTGGNPFFVSESLASDGSATSGAVRDAVRARCRRLAPACQEALAQLCVVPRAVGMDLAAILLGPQALAALAEAEQNGVIEVRPDGLAFRHELARRAIEADLPELRRRLLHRRVLAALRAESSPDRGRLVHHAVAGDDPATVVAVGPSAARAAAAAGSHRQALVLLESVLPYRDRLGGAESAALLDDYGWELYNAHRFHEAVRAGEQAAREYAGLGDEPARGRCLIRVSRHQFMAGETDAAERTAGEAVRILENGADDAAAAHALLYQGAILALTDDFARAVTALESARKRAGRAGRTDLDTLCLNYLGIARIEVGDAGGLAMLRQSVDTARADGLLEYVARGYTNLGEMLFRMGALAEAAGCVRAGLAFAEEHGFWSHAYNMRVHDLLVELRRGGWDRAEPGLRALAQRQDHPDMLYVYSVPWYARLRARRGDPAAAPLLAQAWDRARRGRLLLGMAYAGLAYLEWAWLTNDRQRAEEVAAELLPRLAHPGAAPFRAEAVRYLVRLGVSVDPASSPVTAAAGRQASDAAGTQASELVVTQAYAAGVRGDWATAAAQWATHGDPYEQALELAESPDADTVAGALQTLDGLGAVAAADLVRGRLRDRGARVPRGARRGTRANPAHLTERQLLVLSQLSAGRTNAEIAADLVLSVRTVDHHVAAIFDKLGVRTRQEAAAAARARGIGPATATPEAPHRPA
ncbi:AAA family ATPase [Micromonospora sp. NPDC049204]|uniref:AAA family ATPase n=1 Tax=Micromonospora sp. NPDC049204 TaxID=3154351 RepID=UPI0033FCC03D